MKTTWYRWPENKERGIVPWFVILRRLIFYPLPLTGKIITFVAVFGGFGFSEAKGEWNK